MNGSKIIERVNNTLTTGEWWSIPWWEEDKYYGDGLFTKKEAETAFNELINTFDAKWMIEQRDAVIANAKEWFENHRQEVDNNPQLLYYRQKLDNASEPSEAFKVCQLMGFQASHHLFNNFFAEGLSPFQFLCSLGLDLHTVRKADPLRDLVRRLKNPKEYWESAAFELKLLAQFLRKGFKVKRNYKSGNGKCNCDFNASKRNETVFLEIKRPKKFHRQNEEIIKRSQNRFYTKLVNENIEMEDTMGESLSYKVEIDKVFRLIRYAANKQIPRKGPGIVIVESPHALGWSEFEDAAKKRFQNRRKYSHISAVVLVRALFNTKKGSICHNINIILNPHAKIDISSFDAVKITNALNSN
jgi:hypothetical protein